MKPSSIVLIGMPGSGKSTVGVILAKQTSRSFVDSDLLIQTAEGSSLQQIVDSKGPLALRKIEERILRALACDACVIATGGSAVYSPAAMEHLGSIGPIVFLDVDLRTLEARVRDFATRGIARHTGQSLAELYEERLPLYRKYAGVTIACGGLTQEMVCARIIAQLT